ncbi:cytochrome c biogenesis protein ResB [Glaciihabitans sp. dw_435]|uniref:cytochrome c biogenesis protein ResB n=1 Tax=Glaciihabitans sp. dw_435 TaxID=2720081 RepID=UPI001BD3F936|nr:cytochrome c biogenesis protein ResB [Glaciihabitans sp. dw_435]
MASSRPSDHFDSPAPDKAINQPKLGVIGYLRFFWRQLTSMRTALFLLLLLAFAAVPGSLVPQVTSDPNGVIQYKAANPGLSKVLDFFQIFDTYSSIWFSAIYLLLFISLIGCVVPRTKHHLESLRTKPPKTPARLERLTGFTSTVAEPLEADEVQDAVASAHKLLKRSGYRTRLFTQSGPADGATAMSVSAERGYLRETGNLVFHGALVGILIAVGFGSGFSYTGQKVIVEGQSFTNVLGNYDSFNPGRFFSDSELVPYSIQLDKFTAKYEETNIKAYGQPIDYTADVTTDVPGGEGKSTQTIKVNSPLRIGGTDAYLLGNGYAPWITVRDGEGNVAFSQPVAFLPQDANLTSVGVVKVPDALPEQLGLQGFFYPTVCDTTVCTGALTSVHPDLLDPTLTLQVYTGNLGLDKGVPTSAFALNTDKLTEVAGTKAATPSLLLKVGDTVDLPNGLGSVTFDSVKRFISLDVHHDPTQLWVLGFAVLVLAGLLTGLFVPRRRVWVKAVETEDGVRFEYAGLARGEDPGLEAAIADIAKKHSQHLGLKLSR